MNGERTTFYPSKTSAVSQLELQTNLHEDSEDRGKKKDTMLTNPPY